MRQSQLTTEGERMPKSYLAFRIKATLLDELAALNDLLWPPTTLRLRPLDSPDFDDTSVGLQRQ